MSDHHDETDWDSFSMDDIDWDSHLTNSVTEDPADDTSLLQFTGKFVTAGLELRQKWASDSVDTAFTPPDYHMVELHRRLEHLGPFAREQDEAIARRILVQNAMRRVLTDTASEPQTLSPGLRTDVQIYMVDHL